MRGFSKKKPHKSSKIKNNKTRKENSKMKTAIIIISDPKSNNDESNGRAFNALSLAQESLKAGDDVEISFIGAGTRWPGEMTKVGHPFNALYNSVREAVKAGSCGCAAAFGATESLKTCGIPEAKENAVPGTAGLLSIRSYLANGWNTLVF